MQNLSHAACRHLTARGVVIQNVGEVGSGRDTQICSYNDDGQPMGDDAADRGSQRQRLIGSDDNPGVASGHNFFEKSDLPGIELAWMTQVARLANGNTVIVNCHGRPSDPQIIEVSPEKKIVWSYRDFETLGGATPVAEVLDDPASTIR